MLQLGASPGTRHRRTAAVWFVLMVLDETEQFLFCANHGLESAREGDGRSLCWSWLL